jgi:hypothetical protein
MTSNKFKTDRAIVEEARVLMQGYTYRALLHRVLADPDVANSFDAWVETESEATAMNPHVKKGEVTELGHFDLRLPPGFDSYERRRHWVYVRNDDREVTFVVGVKNKRLLDERGEVDLAALEHEYPD